MVEGRAERWIAGGTHLLTAGEAATTPRGIAHGFRIANHGPARTFVVLTAGGFRIPEDMAAIEESATRHHLRLTGPPLRAG